ncbi:flagellar protein FliS [Qipengyuania sp. ASV99]|uniref:flagellar protein FliS n=1 Tax=Qipengyuania sp. ASV99 TaxID=3399681 RepID=UPI003A4C5E63
MLFQNPAQAYRRVDLDARIEASTGEKLTLICLEEAISALAQALLALERGRDRSPTEPLSRAHGIAMWLARSVAPQNPLYGPMTQFYGGLAAAIARNMQQASLEELAQVREDFADLLAAAKAV